MKCPECGTLMIDVEYPYDSPDHYDGVSEHQCLKCLLRIGRWSGKRLGAEETEPVFGEKREMGA